MQLCLTHPHFQSSFLTLPLTGSFACTVSGFYPTLHPLLSLLAHPHPHVQFLGALLLGRGVTDTVRSGIADRDFFADQPEILMYGMFCALLAAGMWLLLATYFELPVSTTHSIIGYARTLHCSPARAGLALACLLMCVMRCQCWWC